MPPRWTAPTYLALASLLAIGLVLGRARGHAVDDVALVDAIALSFGAVVLAVARLIVGRRSVVPEAGGRPVAARTLDLTLDATGIAVRAPIARRVAWQAVTSVRRDARTYVVATVGIDAPIVIPRRGLPENDAALWSALERTLVAPAGLARGSSLATTIVNSRAARVSA